MHKSLVKVSVLLAGAAGISTAYAVDVGDNTTVGGTVYADFSDITQQQAGTDVPPSGTGFDVKRAYIIVNHTFDDIWTANLTTDASYSSSTTAGSGGVTEVFIKYLYVQAKLNDAFAVQFGSARSSWVPLIEDLTGYRWIDKVAIDRLGFGVSGDWGIHVLGSFADGIVDYNAAVVDGGGYKNPTRTKDVDIEGRIDVHPVPWATLAAGFYNGYLGQVTASNEGYPQQAATRYDLVADAKYAGVHLGFEWFDAKNYRSASPTTGVEVGPVGVVVAATATATVVNDESEGISAWASYDITKQWVLFARYDNARLSLDVDPSLRDVYGLFGLQFSPTKGVDLALVYKNEKVENGTWTISGADAGGSYTIGGTGVKGSGLTTDGTFTEIGIYSQWRF